MCEKNLDVKPEVTIQIHQIKKSDTRIKLREEEIIMNSLIVLPTPF